LPRNGGGHGRLVSKNDDLGGRGWAGDQGRLELIVGDMGLVRAMVFNCAGISLGYLSGDMVAHSATSRY
jgi:hypothetical protein